MTVLIVMDILVISLFICMAAMNIYGLIRMKASGEKFIRVKKWNSKNYSVFWILICLANITLSGASMVDFFQAGHARYYVAEIVGKSAVLTVYLAALLAHIMIICEHVYFSEKYVVVNGCFYSSENISFAVNPPDSDTVSDKRIDLFYRNKKSPFCQIPYNEHTPEEDYYKLLEKYKDRAVTEGKTSKISHPLLLSWLIASVLFTTGAYAYFTVAKPWITIGKCAILKDQKNVSFSSRGGSDSMFPYHSDEETVSDDYYFKPKKSLDGELYKLKELTELRSLNIRTCSISDISFLNNLDSLEELYMGGGDMFDKPDDYSPLDHLTGLKVFEYFGAGKFDRYEALQKMPELHTLLLTHRKIGSYDIDRIKQIPSLENLSLGLCEISDDSGIGSLSGIKVLELGGASMKDPSDLAEIDSVEILYLSGFETDDYSFLLGMKSLKKLHIDKDKLPEEIKSALEKKGVEM